MCVFQYALEADQGTQFNQAYSVTVPLNAFCESQTAAYDLSSSALGYTCKIPPGQSATIPACRGSIIINDASTGSFIVSPAPETTVTCTDGVLAFETALAGVTVSDITAIYCDADN